MIEHETTLARGRPLFVGGQSYGMGRGGETADVDWGNGTASVWC